MLYSGATKNHKYLVAVQTDKFQVPWGYQRVTHSHYTTTALDAPPPPTVQHEPYPARNSRGRVKRRWK